MGVGLYSRKREVRADLPCPALSPDFKSKKVRVNLNQAIRAEQKTENAQVLKDVDEDRKFLIQATIVRIMKSRKTMKHGALVNEVVSISSQRFTPNISMIKKQIETLVEKEYLERQEGQRDTYNYVRCHRLCLFYPTSADLPSLPSPPARLSLTAVPRSFSLAFCPFFTNSTSARISPPSLLNAISTLLHPSQIPRIDPLILSPFPLVASNLSRLVCFSFSFHCCFHSFFPFFFSLLI